VIPAVDFLSLVAEIRRQAAHADSTVHGEAHWRAVAWTYLDLVPLVPGADAEVGLLFGLCHDAMREHDGHDPDHGPRAAAMVRTLAAEGLLALESDRLRTLARAIENHTGGPPTSHPTIGLCQDADRLNLWRCSVRPDPRFLSTVAAREPARIALHQSLPGQHESWAALHARALELGAS